MGKGGRRRREGEIRRGDGEGGEGVRRKRGYEREGLKT